MKRRQEFGYDVSSSWWVGFIGSRNEERQPTGGGGELLMLQRKLEYLTEEALGLTWGARKDIVHNYIWSCSCEQAWICDIVLVFRLPCHSWCFLELFHFASYHASVLKGCWNTWRAFFFLKKKHLEYPELVVGFKSRCIVMAIVVDPNKQIPVDDPLIVTQFNMWKAIKDQHPRKLWRVWLGFFAWVIPGQICESSDEALARKSGLQLA